MDLIYWIIIVALFVLSFVGLIVPIIPGALLIWIGFLIYQILLGGGLGLVFWTAMVILTIALFLADIVANSHFVKRYGGSKWSERVAAVAVIVGAFIAPPFGLILVPFVAVVMTELLMQKGLSLALKVGTASIMAFLSSTLAKLIIQIVMIVWFLIAAI